MKKSDIILIIIIISLSVLLSIVLRRDFTNDTRVNIFVDGELVRSELISDAEPQIIIDSQYGRNIIDVESGTVTVTWSDCASQVCVHSGKISRPGETIVCLPHRLLVSIEGLHKSEDIDAIT